MEVTFTENLAMSNPVKNFQMGLFNEVQDLQNVLKCQIFLDCIKYLLFMSQICVNAFFNGTISDKFHSTFCSDITQYKII